MKYPNRLIVFAFLNLFTLLVSAQSYVRNLAKENWQFCQADSMKWMPAKVPGNVHTDLLAHGIILDPFFGNNEKLVQWVEKKDWIYESTFDISKEELSFSHLELGLENLDTYTKIYINDQLLAQTDNQFRIWKFNLKPHVKLGKNKLKILFESSVNMGLEKQKKLPILCLEEKQFIPAKRPIKYGWDWGPRLVTCGIGKIELRAWNQVKFEQVSYTQKIMPDSSAWVIFTCKFLADSAQNVQLVFSCSEIDETTQTLNAFRLEVGATEKTFRFKINKAKLWWSNGLGDANLYHFNLLLFDINKKHIESKSVAVGIRTIEWVNDKDKSGSFFVALNGRPVFMKGANYIPPHSFINGLDPRYYTKTVLAAKESNMNMLRVWGGGVYPDEAFYQACDENGILVWQDFMFACAMYPGDSVFLTSVAEEVSDQVNRLKNHTSLALWCGNNEVDEGWKNWGWQKQYAYTKSDSSEIAQSYTKLFHEIIPNIIQKEDSGRYYHPSSPAIGWGRAESLTQQDAHYWGVWWGMEPFENLRKKGR